MKSMFNRSFGATFLTESGQESSFAYSIHQYADIYTSKPENLFFYPPEAWLHVPYDIKIMPHHVKVFFFFFFIAHFLLYFFPCSNLKFYTPLIVSILKVMDKGLLYGQVYLRSHCFFISMFLFVHLCEGSSASV